MENEKQFQKIEVNWVGIAPILLMNVANKGAVFPGDEAVKEIMKMARAADKWVEHCVAEENKYAELKQDADDFNERHQGG